MLGKVVINNLSCGSFQKMLTEPVTKKGFRLVEIFPIIWSIINDRWETIIKLSPLAAAVMPSNSS